MIFIQDLGISGLSSMLLILFGILVLVIAIPWLIVFVLLTKVKRFEQHDLDQLTQEQGAANERIEMEMKKRDPWD